MTLEELLNKCIQRGWKPFGIDYNWYKEWCFIYEINSPDGVYSIWSYPTPDRQIVSKESWLWQFVCENKLYPKNRWHKRENDLWNGEIYYEDEWQYYVIESALCDEDKLEEFLLDNIKIWNDMI